ncbi:hypothetical protein ACFSOZ_10870 [Mesorhizobium newzealandense]|uniref:Non-haem dioxygenase N-terminal domain-containing protein n=1 Tax=Mesorhizobium newzealandense TaxID=1300302 RepID=A0ABW4U9C9_9HYPH
MTPDIETIGIADLFGPPSSARDRTDARITAAASGIGFMAVRDFPGDGWLTPERRAQLLRIFALPDDEKQKLLRWNFDRTKKNVYRGWFPLQPAAPSYKEGIDMGPDLANPGLVDAAHIPVSEDPLCEPTPLPAEDALPGWRAAAADYYRAMETVGNALMRSTAHGLGLPEPIFDACFEGGISTLRLIRYPCGTPMPASTPAGRIFRWCTRARRAPSSAASMPIPASSRCWRRTASRACR